MTPRLAAKNLSKIYGSMAVNDKISVTFEPGSFHAIIGENGAGKTTLLKSLFGLHRPDSGQILLNDQEIVWKSPLDAIDGGIGMVQQHFCLVDTLSALDNILLGAEPTRGFDRVDREAAKKRLESLLPSPELAVDWELPVEQLSLGDRQKVEILKLIYRNAKILFLDEPTAVLAPQEIVDLYAVLRRLCAEGRTVVLITHKIHEVIANCDRFTVLRGGKVTAEGSIKDVTDLDLVRFMIGRDLPRSAAPDAKHEGAFVLEARNLSERQKSRGALEQISLKIREGEILGIAGVEGSGQKNLVEVLLGLRPADGSISALGHNATGASAREVREWGLALVPEDRHQEGLWLEESCFHNLIVGLESEFSKFSFMNEGEIQEKSSEWAKQFDVRAPSLDVPVSSLSGGNQQKLIFAREVAGRKPKFLICFQPTRGVDLGAIDLIHSKLRELQSQGLGVLLISSDLDELTKLSNRIQVLFEGRSSKEFLPPYDQFAIGRAMTGVEP